MSNKGRGELSPWNSDRLQHCPNCGKYAQGYGLFFKPIILPRFLRVLLKKEEVVYFKCWGCGCRYTRPYTPQEKNAPWNFPN